MAIIIVDNKSYTVDERQNLLAACLGHGLNVPISAGTRRWDLSAHAASARSNSSKTIMISLVGW
jgi:hypothetical protein